MPNLCLSYDSGSRELTSFVFHSDATTDCHWLIMQLFYVKKSFFIFYCIFAWENTLHADVGQRELFNKLKVGIELGESSMNQSCIRNYIQSFSVLLHI